MSHKEYEAMGQQSGCSCNAVRKTVLPCVTWSYETFWRNLPTEVGMTTAGNINRNPLSACVYPYTVLIFNVIYAVTGAYLCCKLVPYFCEYHVDCQSKSLDFASI